MTGNLTWAQQWVLRQLRFDRTDEDRVRDLPQILEEWTQVLEASRRYALTGILADRLPSTLIPEEVAVRLERARRGMQHASLVQWITLEEWLQRLRAASIPVIVLKGAALVRLVYGRLDVRPMADIDFLVQREHLESAVRLLSEAGLTRAADVEGQDRVLRTQVMFHTPQPHPTYIEIHWHLIDSTYYAQHVPIQWFWDHTVELNEEKPTIRVLSPEAQLLHLAAHLELHHAGASLISLYDIAALLVKFRTVLDWDLVTEAAAHFQWGWSLRTAAQEAQSVFGVSLPTQTSSRLAQLPTTYRERLARTLATRQAHAATFIFDGWDQGSWRYKLDYWKHCLLPADAFMRERNPTSGSISVLAHARRLMRGLVRIPVALVAAMVIFYRLGRQKYRFSALSHATKSAFAVRSIASPGSERA